MSIKASNKGIIKEDEIWTVYVHIIPKEISEYDYDKYYVGITSRPVKYRWNNGNHYKEQLFYKAIKKYGIDFDKNNKPILKGDDKYANRT